MEDPFSFDSASPDVSSDLASLTDPAADAGSWQNSYEAEPSGYGYAHDQPALPVSAPTPGDFRADLSDFLYFPEDHDLPQESPEGYASHPISQPFDGNSQNEPISLKEEPPAPVAQPEPSTTKLASSQKRKTKGKGNGKGRKKPLEPHEREEAAARRQEGACLYCRFRKIKCNPSQDSQRCQNCVKRALYCGPYGEDFKRNVLGLWRLHQDNNSGIPRALSTRRESLVPDKLVLLIRPEAADSPPFPRWEIPITRTQLNWDVSPYSTVHISYALGDTLRVVAAEIYRWIRPDWRDDGLDSGEASVECRGLLALLDLFPTRSFPPATAECGGSRVKSIVSQSLFMSIILELEACLREFCDELLRFTTYVGPKQSYERNHRLMSRLALVITVFDRLAKPLPQSQSASPDFLDCLQFKIGSAARDAVQMVNKFASVITHATAIRRHEKLDLQTFLDRAKLDMPPCTMELGYYRTYAPIGSRAVAEDTLGDVSLDDGMILDPQILGPNAASFASSRVADETPAYPVQAEPFEDERQLYPSHLNGMNFAGSSRWGADPRTGFSRQGFTHHQQQFEDLESPELEVWR